MVPIRRPPQLIIPPFRGCFEIKNLLSSNLKYPKTTYQPLPLPDSTSETSSCLSVPIENSDRPDFEKLTARIVSLCALPDNLSSVV